MAETSPPSFAQSFQKDPVQGVEAYFLMRYLAEEGKKLRLDEESPLKEQLEVLRMNVLAEAYFNHELNLHSQRRRNRRLLHQEPNALPAGPHQRH